MLIIKSRTNTTTTTTSSSKNKRSNAQLNNCVKKYCLLIINIPLILLTIILTTPHQVSLVHGINYKEFFDNVNPYMASQVVQEYSRFAGQVNQALGIEEDNLNDTTNDLPSRKNVESSLQNVRTTSSTGLNTYSSSSSSDSNYKSAIGVSIILAVAREHIWDSLELADKGLDQIVRTAPASLPTVMGTLLKTAEQEYNTKIRSIIFTPTWIKSTLRLVEGLKSEVKQAYFDLPDHAMDTINNVISTRVPDSHNFPSYLTGPLPQDTESVIVNLKQQKGQWPTSTSYVGSTSTFNASGIGESAEMFEIRGKFKFSQDQQFVYVTIPFRMTKLALTLILPNDDNDEGFKQQRQFDDAAAADDESGTHYRHFRLHLPIKTFISRTPVKTTENNNNNRNCDTAASLGREYSHCLEFLDTLSYTSFTPNEFQFININAGVVRREGHIYSKTKQNRLRSSSSSSFLERWRYYVPSPNRNHLRHNNFPYQKIWKWKSSPSAINSYSNKNNFYHNNNNNYYYNNQPEITLVFNKPFFWFVRGTV